MLNKIMWKYFISKHHKAFKTRHDATTTNTILAAQTVNNAYNIDNFFRFQDINKSDFLGLIEYDFVSTTRKIKETTHFVFCFRY